jgi:YVTN family beta-propeller protein
MKNPSCLSPLALLLAVAACSSPSNEPDLGSTPFDGGNPGPSLDAGMPPLDGGDVDAGGTDAGPIDTGVPPRPKPPQVSRSIALSLDEQSLWVVNTESDSISEIDLGTRSLKREIALSAHPPQVDATGRYEPAIRPRALAVVDTMQKIYVAGQAANRVLVLSLPSGAVTTSIAVGAEPVSVVATKDGTSVFVVSHQSATVHKIDTRTDSVMMTADVGEHPWGASLKNDDSQLYVSHLLLNPGVTLLDAATLTVSSSVAFPKQAMDPSMNRLLPYGEARSVYAVVPRPNNGELWVAHLLLATDTVQPALDFQSTVFPTFTIISPDGSGISSRLLLRPSTVLSASGAFSDVVSGPRDIAFTNDGKLALVAMAQSEDVMVFDAEQKVEKGLVRPTPSALIEGIVVSSDSSHAYLQGRASHNVTVLAISGGSGTGVVVDGDPIECLASDPMPADMRHGMRLFYSSNSAAFPITQNFWVACASCHPEGQSDDVVWKFLEGPRDTPSNAGGPINTGFLFRQAMRNDVVDYDETIRVEQGGNYHRTSPTQLPDLQALARFVNYAIPFPQNPNRSADGVLTPSQANGKMLFEDNCANCHAGPYLTDSGFGNPTLDLNGLVRLHDIGTCVTSGPHPDQPSMDILGNPREACMFDTPTLRGIFATAPYFHDGSAVTLDEAVARIPAASSLSSSSRADLVAYLKTL